MYPRNYNPGFYPPGSVIERETRRNNAAVTYLAGVADNPRKVIGLGGDTTPPEVALEITPPAPWLVGAPLTLAATATDDVGVTLVAWQVDGETVAMDTTAPSARRGRRRARQVHDPSAGVRRGCERGRIGADDGDNVGGATDIFAMINTHHETPYRSVSAHLRYAQGTQPHF